MMSIVVCLLPRETIRIRTISSITLLLFCYRSIRCCLFRKCEEREHNENFPSKHLIIEHLIADADVDIFGLSNIRCQGKFIVSIRVLREDIKKSVIKSPVGYLEDLNNDPELQSKFVIAINQIYDPILVD